MKLHFMSEIPDDIIRPPFRIDCVSEEGPHTDYEAFCGAWRGDNQLLYLKVTTQADKFMCIVTRSDMQQLFDAIQRRGVTITFSPKKS